MIDYSEIYEKSLKKNKELKDIRERSIDDEVIGSHGINGIVSVFMDEVKSKIIPIWDTSLVNVSTLIRNNIDDDLNDKIIIDKTMEDIFILLTVIKEFYFYSRIKPNFPCIIFYAPLYDALNLHKRDNKTNNRIDKLINKMISLNYFNKSYTNIKPENINNIFCFSIMLGNSRRLPHIELLDMLDKLNKDFNRINKSYIQNERRYMLISHNPVDFHLFKYLKNIWLMESYTGSIKEQQDIPSKIFKLPFLPFNKYTHLLFGDSIFIKPLVQRKQKQLFLDKAQKERWKYKTEEGIYQDIIRTNLIHKEDLKDVVL